MEKEAIEKATAEGFLSLYNKHINSDYKIISFGDAPDIECKNSDNEILNLEVTSAQDQSGDIQALLGRSNHKNIENLRISSPPNFVNFNVDICASMAAAINAKISKRYGSNTALVVRDTSGCDWDTIIEDLKTKLDRPIPYDKGIWIISRDKRKLYCVV